MMRKYLSVIALSTVVITGCNAPESKNNVSQNSYSGEENRQIKAMSEEKVQGLLDGKGLEYALAAELNHYPGPRHTLDLSEELHLTEIQEKELNELALIMSEEAKNWGKQLVELESKLDKQFASGKVTKDQLEKLTQQIAMVEGNLRNAHLTTHLNTKEILSAEQVALYDELRGYTGENKNKQSSENNNHTNH